MVPVERFQEEDCDEGYTVEVKAQIHDVDKENKMKRKKKKVPAGGFQDVEVKVKMDENMTKKKKIAQENDSGKLKIKEK